VQNKVDNRQLRSFGLTVGGVFVAIALWPVIFHWAGPRWWSLVLATLLIGPAIIYPKILLWPHKGWMTLGHVLGWINTRLILGVIFYAVVTPIGIVRRLLGKDPMGRKIEPEVDTYRVVRSPRQPTHLTKQY
jgi:hypothetical protein